MYESQVATASRAITQIADFSQTEEINESSDNDDRLTWQEVR
jgi:hypothetical protein